MLQFFSIVTEVIVQFSATSYTVDEGESVVVGVELVGVSVLEIRVTLDTQNNLAKYGN